MSCDDDGHHLTLYRAAAPASIALSSLSSVHLHKLTVKSRSSSPRIVALDSFFSGWEPASSLGNECPAAARIVITVAQRMHDVRVHLPTEARDMVAYNAQELAHGHEHDQTCRQVLRCSIYSLAIQPSSEERTRTLDFHRNFM